MKNEQIKEAQETKKREAEKKKKEMEEQRQAELKRKLDTELAAQKTAGEVRRKFCLLRTLKHRIRALNLNIPCLRSNFHLVIPQHFICKAVIFPWRCRHERRQKISQPKRVRINDFQKSDMSIFSLILGSFYSSKN